MQYHNYVTDTESRYWPRCSNVEPQGERLMCVLDWSRKYDLTQTYLYQPHGRPHLDFLNVKTDGDLAGFIRRWGPLWLVHRNGRPNEPEPEKRRYWSFHRHVKARLNLIEAFKSREKSALTDAIWESIAVDDEKSEGIGTGSPGPIAFYLGLLLKAEGDPRDWVPGADFSQLRSVASHCIQSGFSVSSNLAALWRNGRAEISWKPHVQNLAEAIEWMFWHDIAGRRPLSFCMECGTAFVPESAHSRKFCDTPCAHRAAVREYRKRLKKEANKILGGMPKKGKRRDN